MPDPTPIKSSTQQNIDIEDITDNLVLLKDGSAVLVITTTAVNFGLLSEAEQDATIYAYAALLNSLTFPIQIFIRSNRKDISGYERLLSEQEARSPKPENKERIKKYREFIEETVRQRNVLDKKFYIVIPFSVLELGITKSATALAKGAKQGLPFPKEYILSRAKMMLEPKRDHLLHQLTRLGLRARQLSTKELIQLLFEIYNPVSAQGQILAAPEEYKTPLVQPAVAFQETPQIEIPEQKPISSPATQENIVAPKKPSPNQPPLPQNEPAVSKDSPVISQVNNVPSSDPNMNPVVVSQDASSSPVITQTNPVVTDQVQNLIDAALGEKQEKK